LADSEVEFLTTKSAGNIEPRCEGLNRWPLRSLPSLLDIKNNSKLTESITVLLREIVQVVEGSFLSGKEHDELAVPYAAASDLMSDVLAFSKPRAVLLTGLANTHVIHTAEMADIVAIIFVRGKVPAAEVISLAEEKEIPLISSPLTMYELCGRLFQAGLAGCDLQAKA